MWKNWEEQLTPQAAEEDAEKFITSLADVFREMWIYYFLEPTDLRGLYSRARQKIEQLSPEDLLDQMFHAFGIRVHTVELMKNAVRKVYAYARGEDVEGIGLADELVTYWGRALWKLYMAFDPIEGSKINFPSFSKIEISVQSQEIFAKTVSPRFMHALRMYQLRRHVISALYLLQWDDIQEQKQNRVAEQSAFLDMVSIDPASLAFLANVSYPYIIKLIRKRKLPAYKKEDSKFWLIPIPAALKFASSRPDCPEWVKRLAGG